MSKQDKSKNWKINITYTKIINEEGTSDETIQVFTEKKAYKEA